MCNLGAPSIRLHQLVSGGGPCLYVRPPGQDRCIQGTVDAEVRKNPTPGHSNFDAGHSNSDTG